MEITINQLGVPVSGAIKIFLKFFLDNISHIQEIRHRFVIINVSQILIFTETKTYFEL